MSIDLFSAINVKPKLYKLERKTFKMKAHKYLIFLLDLSFYLLVINIPKQQSQK